MGSGTNNLRMEYERHISEHQEWREGCWGLGRPMLRGQAESFGGGAKAIPSPQPRDTVLEPRPSKTKAVEDSDIEEPRRHTGITHLLDQLSRLTVQLSSRPSIGRSNGSSTASDVSTSITPPEFLWIGSTYSPSLMDSTDSGPASSPCQSNFLPVKFGKDALDGDFRLNWQFRFPQIPTSSSPGFLEPDLFLDNYTQFTIPPTYSYQDRVGLERFKWARIPIKPHNCTTMSGLGVISKDGHYSQDIILPSKSSARRGPLTPEQRQNAALMRRRGACRDCRRRKVKV